MSRSERWSDPRAKVLAASVWDAARPQVCRTLGLSSEPSPALTALGAELDEAYCRTSGGLAATAAVELADGKVKLCALDRLEERSTPTGHTRSTWPPSSTEPAPAR